MMAQDYPLAMRHQGAEKEAQTAASHSLNTQRPPVLTEGQTKQLVARYLRITKGGRERKVETLREIINLVYAQGHRAGRHFASRKEKTNASS